MKEGHPEFSKDTWTNFVCGTDSKGTIDSFPCITDEISYESFARKFLQNNIPCLIKCESIKDWNSSKDWIVTKGEEIKQPNMDFLQCIVSGNAKVPVSHCDKKYFNSQKVCEMPFEDYCKYWDSADRDPLLYLKDWHFQRDVPNYCAYQTPIYFSSDWLNEFWQENKLSQDDYRFVYIGPKKSWTPLHMDVYGSYSWSSNVVGKKKWIFFPPGQEQLLKDKFGKLIYNFNDISPEKAKEVKRFEVIQEGGDLIFVPSLWHHQVENLEDTISINHNWFNGFNVEHIFGALLQALLEVEVEIDDCKKVSTREEFQESCQKLLKANHGMDFDEFAEILTFIANKRIRLLEGEQLDQSLGRNHAKFDLMKISQIFSEKFDCITQNCLKFTSDTIKDLQRSIHIAIQSEKSTSRNNLTSNQ